MVLRPISVVFRDGSGKGPGYTSEQRFILVENTSWGTGWTTDPVSGGNLYEGQDANGNFIDGFDISQNTGG